MTAQTPGLVQVLQLKRGGVNLVLDLSLFSQ